MDDDLGTPAAVAVIHDAVREGNKLLADGDVAGAARHRRVGARDARRARARPRRPGLAARRRLATTPSSTAAVDALVAGLLEQRAAARAAKDFAAADAIRDQIKAAGIEVEDTPDGPKWTLCRTSERDDRTDGRELASARARSGRPARATRPPAPAAASSAASRARARRRRPRTARTTRPTRQRSEAEQAAARAAASVGATAGDAEWIAGRNSVVEALRAGVPVTAVYVAEGAERDGRLREAFQLAADRGISLLEVTRGRARPDDRRGRAPGPRRADPGVRVRPPRRPARPRPPSAASRR